MYARQGTLQKITEQQVLAFLASEGYTKTDKTKNKLAGKYTNGKNFAVISKSCKRGFYLVSCGVSF